MAALKSCGEQLLQSWGVDSKRFRPVVPPGQPRYVDLTKSMRGGDYPTLVDGTPGGRTTALLSLSADGKVQDCRVIEGSGTPALDIRTCHIALSRMRYPPVQDSGGQPVASWTMLSIKWGAW